MVTCSWSVWGAEGTQIKGEGGICSNNYDALYTQLLEGIGIDLGGSSLI